MSDKEKTNCNCNCDENTPDCTCEDDNCDCGCDTLTFEMEDGTTKEFQILEIIEHEGIKYVALAEPEGEEYYIMEMEEQDENLEFSFVEDDDLYNTIVAKFEEIFDLYEKESEEE